MSYKILAIDGNYLAHNRFATTQGVVGAFLSKLFALQREWKPALTYVTWDHPQGDEFRRKIHPDYKAGRSERPPEFGDGLERLQRVLPWFGVTQFVAAEPAEADDVLATIARIHPGRKLLWSADKDLLQLVSHHVHLLRAGREDVLITDETIERVEVKINGTPVSGLRAKGWLDLQTLVGDSCDKVPGVPGIGPVKGLQLLEAMPQLVDSILTGQVTAPWKTETASSKEERNLLRLANKVVLERLELAKTRSLVMLYSVDLAPTIADPDPLRALRWLEHQGLEWLTKRWDSAPAQPVYVTEPPKLELEDLPDAMPDPVDVGF